MKESGQIALFVAISEAIWRTNSDDKHAVVFWILPRARDALPRRGEIFVGAECLEPIALVQVRNLLLNSKSCSWKVFDRNGRGSTAKSYLSSNLLNKVGSGGSMWNHDKERALIVMKSHDDRPRWSDRTWQSRSPKPAAAVRTTVRLCIWLSRSRR